MLDDYKDEINLEHAFGSACFGENIDMVKMLIDRGVRCWDMGLFWTWSKCIVELIIEKSGGHVSKRLLLSMSKNLNWNDLLVSVVYNLYDENRYCLRLNYDILDIFEFKLNSIVNVKVKLFDRNLFFARK
jgi:hypothetical protein